MIQTLLTSTEPAYVRHFSSAFEELWSNGVDAREKIREIELGLSSETALVFNPYRTERLYREVVEGAEREVLLIVPTANAIERQKGIGVFDLLKQASSRGVRIRILAPDGCKVRDLAELPRVEVRQLLSGDPGRGSTGEERKQGDRQPVQNGEGESRTKVTIVIADGKMSLVVELQDDSQMEFARAVGPSVFSTSKSTVLSYTRIFESLWVEATLNEKLKEADRMQKEFINIAAHELRTPVQPIIGLAELVRDRADGGSGEAILTKEELAMLVRNANRLHRLSSNILEVTRIEGQTLRLNRERFDLGSVIEEALRDARGYSNGGSAVSIKYEPRPVFVNGDPGKLVQVISNLLSNALKFTEEGEVSVTVEDDEGAGRVTVTVRDTGEGIDPQVLPRLFQKFATSSRFTSGTGLGLFISRSIVEAHGGEMRADNNPCGKRGASFRSRSPSRKRVLDF